MLDLPDILAHLGHANMVLGGGLLFASGGAPLLSLEEFLDDRQRGAARLTSAVLVQKLPRGRERRSANSAEGIRAIMRTLGVTPRPPTDQPVDVWSRN